MISKIPNRRREYVRALSNGAAFLIACDKSAEVLAAARSIEGKLDRAQLWVTIMHWLAATGRTEEGLALAAEAIQLIDSVDDYDERAREFAKLSEVLAECGQLQEARRAAGKCHLLNERLAALTRIVEGWLNRKAAARS
jgi:hypothetical protein